MSVKETDGEDSKAAIESVVLDLGRHKRRLVQRLRRGEGSLYQDVQETVQHLKDKGALDANAGTVIVVVERKPDLTMNPFAVFNMMDDDDDDDDDDD